MGWKADRLARNRRDQARLMGILETKGRHLILVREPVDTTSPAGRAMLDMLNT